MAVGDQNFKVRLTFVDEATGKVIKATQDQINAVKKLGIAVGNESSKVAVDLDKMAKAHEELGRKTRTSDQRVTGFIRAMGSLRNMILVYFFALKPLINLITESAKAFSEQEDAIKRINFAMGLQGTYSKSTSENLIELSQSFQKVTRYGDEAVLEVMEKLVTIGKVMPTQLGRVTQATLDFASATGRDLATASDIMAKASAGYTAQLSRYGIVIDKNISDSQKLEEVLKFVEKRMGGRAQADVESFSGRLAQASNAMNDLKESVGKLISEGLNLPVVINYWKDAFAGLNKSISGEGATVLDTLEKRLNTINKQIVDSGAKEISKKKPSPFWFITGGYSESEIKKAQDLLINRDNIVNSIIFENKVQANLKLSEEQKANELKISQDKLKIQEDFEEVYLSFQRTRASFRLTELDKEYATYKSAYADNVKELLEIDEWYAVQKAKLLKEGLKENQKDLIGDAKIMNDIMKSTAEAMRDSMADGFFKVIEGDFEGLQDVAAAFGQTIIKILLQALATKAMVSIGLGGLLGLAHSGGYMLGAGSFTNVRRFHSGGMSNDEIPAILKRNEGVVNERGMNSIGVDNLNRLNRGEGVGGGDTINNYYIQAIDVKSFRERLQQHGDIYAGASEGAIRDNGSLRRTSLKWG